MDCNQTVGSMFYRPGDLAGTITAGYKRKMESMTKMLDRKHLISRSMLKETIRQLLNSSEFTIVSAAAHLRTSPRSLQRQLEISKITYSEVVDEVRHELASQLLASTDLGIAKIGASLGYRDPSSFSRAFLRWSGTSPRQYRDIYKSASTAIDEDPDDPGRDRVPPIKIVKPASFPNDLT